MVWLTCSCRVCCLYGFISMRNCSGWCKLLYFGDNPLADIGTWRISSRVRFLLFLLPTISRVLLIGVVLNICPHIWVMSLLKKMKSVFIHTMEEPIVVYFAELTYICEENSDCKFLYRVFLASTHPFSPLQTFPPPLPPLISFPH